MTPRVRTGVFAAAAVAILPALVKLAGHMPAFGDHPSPYGDAINAAGPVLRHVGNSVTALNFDFRGIDTLGEEFILLCAVTGVTVLLRGNRGEADSAEPGTVDGRPILPPSDATTWACRVLGTVLLVFALSVTLHAASTPGGGFQAGVMIASGFLFVFLGEGYKVWRRVVRSEWADALEAAGAMIYVLCGFAGLLVGAPFLANVLPLGELNQVWSGGLIAAINVGVTCAVTGGFLVLFLEFLEETRIDPGLEEEEE